MKSGQFAGTTNGVLCFKNPEGKQVILDFQGSNAYLEIEPDPDEVYDISWKNYTAFTTSGKTKIEYHTYAYANSLEIVYREQIFSIDAIDGACDMAIDGLSYTYWAETETEYLILTVKKEIVLSNYRFLLEKNNDDDDSAEIIRKVRSKEQFIRLQPNSVIVFAIKRTNDLQK